MREFCFFIQHHAAMSARPRSARTLRDYYVRCGAGIRATLGALPLIPHQGTSRCSIVALRPIGLIACFAPRLRVAVPAIGRAPLWRSGPSTFTQNHAAVSARPRSARTLRVSLCGLWPRGTGTLGGRCPPKTPWQEPEVPAPPTSPQTHAAAPARPRFARTLRASSVRCGRTGYGLR